MAKQTKTMSLVESVTNMSIGLAVALTTQLVVFKIYKIETTINENLEIAVIFAIMSILRSYIVRRFFERLNKRKLSNIWYNDII